MKPHLLFLSIAFGALALTPVAARAQTTTRASLAWNGAQGNGHSPEVGARISGNGQYVVFRSLASNLVPGDTNGQADVFVRDRLTGAITLVSVAADGVTPGNGPSGNPRISADGRFIAFGSSATNLVAGGSSGIQVFVRDMSTGTTSLVSVADGPSGVAGNLDSNSSAISADGNVIVFRSLATNLVATPTPVSGGHVYVRNRALQTTTLVSVDPSGNPGNGDSGQTQTSISDDGRYVGFASEASNLVAGDNNNASDAFVRDLATGITERISLSSGAQEGNAGSWSSNVSPDGRYVAFTSAASNLVGGDTNNCGDVFLRDRLFGTTVRVSVDSSGKQGNNTSGNTNGWGIAISRDGTKVAFQSLATNLVKGDTNGFEDVFVRDLVTQKTTMVSVTPAGKPGNGLTGGLNTCSVSISADGNTVMFTSYATNLVSGDTNGFMDVFVRGPLP